MKKNIIIFYVLAFVQGLIFVSSVATLYRTNNGITLWEMGIIESIFAFLIIVFEIPWGYIADRIGYKRTIIIANAFYFLSKLVFYLANSFNTFLLERVLLALALSGLSGVDSNLLYLSLDNKDDATKVYAIQGAFGTLGMVVSSLSFSYLLNTNMRLGALITSVAYLIAVVLSCFLDDHKVIKQSKVTFSQIVRSLYDSKHIILCLIASTLLVETLHTFTIFYNQLQYTRVNLDIKYFAPIFVVLQLVGLLSGVVAKLTKYFKKEMIGLCLYLVGIIGSIMLVYTKTIVASIIIFMLMTLSEALYLAIFSAIQNDSIKISSRATMLSIYSMINNVVMMFTSTSFGYISSLSLEYAYRLGFVFSFVGMLLFVWYWIIETNVQHLNKKIKK